MGVASKRSLKILCPNERVIGRTARGGAPWRTFSHHQVSIVFPVSLHSSKIAISTSRMATPARDVIDLTAETPPASSNNNNNNSNAAADDDDDEVVVIENEDQEDDDTPWHFLLEMSAASYRYVRIVGTATNRGELRAGIVTHSQSIAPSLTFSLLLDLFCIQQASGTTGVSRIPGST